MAGYTEFGSVNAAPTTFSLQNIYTLSDDVNWTRGKHAFKFGILLNRFNEASQATNSFNGQLQYNQLSDFLQDIPAVVEFAPTLANENRFFHLQHLRLLRPGRLAGNAAADREPGLAL